MKTLRHLVLVIAAAMFMAACGTGTDDPDNGDDNGNGNGEPETGSIVVTVVDDNSGDSLEGEITLADSDGNELDTVTDDSVTFSDLEAGTYTVTVTADGYLDLPDQSLTVEAGETTTYTARMEPEGDDGDVSGSVANVEIVGFTDVDGNAYDSETEVNVNKDAELVVAQTEEMVGVTVLVTDADGNPVTEAPVTVNALGFADLSVAIYPGRPDTLNTAETASFDGLRTNADGEAHFVVEAVYGAGITSFSTILELMTGFQGNKFIVSAVGSDNSVQRAEFKGAFINMSHLYAGWFLPSDFDGDYADLPEDERPELLGSDQRMGADFGTEVNIWNTGTDNAHDITTYAYAKQPQLGPVPLGQIGSFNVSFEEGERIVQFGGAAVEAEQLQTAAGIGDGGVAGTFVQYELSGEDVDSVSWIDDGSVDGGCDVVSSDGLICVDTDGDGVSLVPDSDVTLEDLPIQATVDASFVVVATYGFEGVEEPRIYTFDLKNYSFTKTWVGGFLTVDKHVDNHVLTWSGEDVTLDAQDAQTDDPWTSTVHVDVTNDSDSNIYNVTVRDALPPELGIVEGSISNGGTYDEVNHVVTWDFNTTPDLQDIPVDETVEVSFDVYARHKPGYCWEGTGDGSYNIQPNPEGDCYADPYLTTNGEADQSVTAAGFFEPDNTSGSQPVFSYSPDADESDIWVVRPLFEIAKERTSAATMEEGASATYELTVTHVDRSDEEGEAYYDLAQMYPWEFGDDTEGTGHQADGYELRNNTYAQDLEVTDAWEVGLDFTNGTPFSTEDGEVGSIDTSSAGSDKTVSWSIGELEVGATATAELVLTGNLLSDDGDGNAVNNSNSDYGPSDPDEANTVPNTTGAEPESFNAWNNCLYLDGAQLNQPEVVDGTWYAETEGVPWNQNEITSTSDAEWMQATATSPADFSFGGAVGALAPDVCAPVAVMPPPDEPFMNISTNGESNDSDVEASQVEDVEVGTTYYYRFTAQNVGDVVTEDVAITVEAEVDNPNTSDPSDGSLTFTGTAQLYEWDDTSTSWNAVAGATGNFSGDTVSFDPLDLDPDHRFRVVIEAEADSAGELWVQSELTYSNASAGSQTNPIGPVYERTDVQ